MLQQRCEQATAKDFHTVMWNVDRPRLIESVHGAIVPNEAPFNGHRGEGPTRARWDRLEH